MIKRLRLISFLVLLVSVYGMGYGQSGMISGKVTDVSDNPLIGATVVIEGTTLGTATNLDGVYTISRVPAGELTLRISSVGFKPQTSVIQLDDGQEITLNFKLEEDVMNMEELVVVGYGTKRKRNITSAIAKVKAQEIENVSVPSFEAALQGRSSGVQVTSDNGLAGEPITIRVRGTSSLSASSQPLYVIDGVPVIAGDYGSSGFADGTNALALINPADIESIEILKDASAAAIYGS